MDKYFDINNDYIEQINAFYWEEEAEMKLDIHPSQIEERIKENIGNNSGNITFLDWKYEGMRVGVYIDNKFYGVFDYDINEFESTPDERLTENLETNGFGLNNLD